MAGRTEKPRPDISRQARGGETGSRARTRAVGSVPEPAGEDAEGRRLLRALPGHGHTPGTTHGRPPLEQGGEGDSSGPGMRLVRRRTGRGRVPHGSDDRGRSGPRHRRDGQMGKRIRRNHGDGLQEIPADRGRSRPGDPASRTAPEKRMQSSHDRRVRTEHEERITEGGSDRYRDPRTARCRGRNEAAVLPERAGGRTPPDGIGRK